MLQIWPAATPASTSNPKNVVLFPTWSVQTHKSGWLVAPAWKSKTPAAPFMLLYWDDEEPARTNSM